MPNGFDDMLHLVVVHGGFNLDLGQKIHHVLGAPVQLGVAFLAAKTLDLRHGDTAYADVRERLAHLVQLEGFDDGGHDAHAVLLRSGG